jgi:hypothetical protein
MVIVKVRRILAAMGMSVVMAGALVVLTTQAAGATDVGVPRPIVNVGSGKCLTVQPDANGYVADGLRIVQQSCNGSDLQAWMFLSAGQHCQGLFCSFQTPLYQIQNRYTGKCIDLRDGSNADWTPVQQWTCVGHPNMEWAPGNGNSLIDEHSGTCLDVEWGSHDDGAPLQGFHCTQDNLAQQYVQG